MIIANGASNLSFKLNNLTECRTAFIFHRPAEGEESLEILFLVAGRSSWPNENVLAISATCQMPDGCPLVG